MVQYYNATAISKKRGDIVNMGLIWLAIIIHGYIIPEWELIKNAILYEYNGDDM
jgi:hypothetical protein